MLPHITFRFNGQPIENLPSMDISHMNTRIISPGPISLVDINGDAADDDDDGNGISDEPLVLGDIRSLIEKATRLANICRLVSE